MSTKWLVLGISGTTCSGKTTIANDLKRLFPNIEYIHQDNYFLPITSEKHVLIPELNHFNWELLSSLDMEQMYDDVKQVVNNIVYKEKKQIDRAPRLNGNFNMASDIEFIKNILNEKNTNIFLIEGFSFLNYEPIESLCNLKFYLTLSYETCYQRRMNRVYDPADVPGYFEKCVWPEHVAKLQELQTKVTDLIYLDESIPNHLDCILKHLRMLCESL